MIDIDAYSFKDCYISIALGLSLLLYLYPFIRKALNPMELMILHNVYMTCETVVVLLVPLGFLLLLGEVSYLERHYPLPPNSQDEPYSLIYMMTPALFIGLPGFTSFHIYFRAWARANAAHYRYGHLKKVWLVAYGAVNIALTLIIHGLFGDITFDLNRKPVGRSLMNSTRGTLYALDGHGRIQLMRYNPNAGLLTHLLHENTSPWIFFWILFYVKHLQYTAYFRWVHYIPSYVLEKLFGWLFEGIYV